MNHALALGARGLGQTWPNPSVGCVIVKNDQILGRGWTAPGGAPHAEVIALAQAGPNPRGATAYVTLEPCAHHGKTPPCTEALIAAGITRVVAAIGDPDPRVNGSGFAQLRKAAITVETGVGETAACVAHKGFILRLSEGRPMVTLKLASSLDGRIATAAGESRWITGAPARRQVHTMRASHDAVMIGAGTARADDPSLSVRDIGVSDQPVRIVLTTNLDIPTNGKLAKTARNQPLWLVHGHNIKRELTDIWQGLGARLLVCDSDKSGQLDTLSALRVLGRAGLTRVLCEGGGALAASLISRALVDELVCFSAGKALGGDARPMLAAMGIEKLTQAAQFGLIDQRDIGGDVQSRWRPVAT